MFAHNRIPKVRGRIREDISSMQTIGVVPSKGKEAGTKEEKRRVVFCLPQRHIVLAHKDKVKDNVSKGQTAAGMVPPVRLLRCITLNVKKRNNERYLS